MNAQTLNEFLTERGVTTNLKHKRTLAKAFGLPMQTGTPEEEAALLMAFKACSGIANGKATETFRVEVASFEADEKPYMCSDLDQVQERMDLLKSENKLCRALRVITITQVI